LVDTLLDPSWVLARYNIALREYSTSNDRPALHIKGERKSVRRGADRFAQEIETTVDCERRFLHRLTSFGEDGSVEVIELGRLRLDAAIDDALFRVDVDALPAVDARADPNRHHRLGQRSRAWARP
jgi:hypothetical protein